MKLNNYLIAVICMCLVLIGDVLGVHLITKYFGNAPLLCVSLGVFLSAAMIYVYKKLT